MEKVKRGWIIDEINLQQYNDANYSILILATLHVQNEIVYMIFNFQFWRDVLIEILTSSIFSLGVYFHRCFDTTLSIALKSG